VHTSFRAVRPVEGGPRGLIAALQAAVGPSGTLVMLSYTGDADVPFDPLTTPSAVDLGVVADTFWRLPGVRRSDHPEAFAAAGPLAARIVDGPLPLPPHRYESPVGRAYDLDGQVLLLGVGHEANTSLHLAELLAEVPYRVPKHCTILQEAASSSRLLMAGYARLACRPRAGSATPRPASFGSAASCAWPSSVSRAIRCSFCTLPSSAVKSATSRALRAAVIGQVLGEPGVPGAFDVGDRFGLGVLAAIVGGDQADHAQVGALDVRVGKRVVAHDHLARGLEIGQGGLELAGVGP
jgi:hypothetical protein